MKPNQNNSENQRPVPEETSISTEVDYLGRYKHTWAIVLALLAMGYYTYCYESPEEFMEDVGLAVKKIQGDYYSDPTADETLTSIESAIEKFYTDDNQVLSEY